MITRICAPYKASCGEPVWKAIGDRLRRPYYLSRVDLDWKIRNMMHRTDIGKYSCVNRTKQLWDKLPINSLRTFPSKLITFRTSIRKVIIEGEGIRSEEKIEYFQEKGLKCDK